MKVNKVTFVTLFLSSMIARSQEVDSKAYGVLLGTLLSHSVPEVSVKTTDSINHPIFVDSRERNEYEVSHIKNAIWVGYDELNLDPLKEVDKDKNIIVYCSVGYRSEKVAEKLINMGFKNVSNLYGGIFEWKNQGKEIYNPKGVPTDSIHAYNRVWGVWLKKGEKVY